VLIYLSKFFLAKQCASFSLFPVGNSTVFCSAQDLSGNIGNGTFSVQVLIPQWVKTLAGHWCVDEVDDLSFAQVVNFLVDLGILDRPNEWGAESVLTVPDWGKTKWLLVGCRLNL